MPDFPDHALPVSLSVLSLYYLSVAASADAYLTPHVKRYVQSFCAGFTNIQVKYLTSSTLAVYELYLCKCLQWLYWLCVLQDVRVQFMQSDGGLTPVHK